MAQFEQFPSLKTPDVNGEKQRIALFLPKVIGGMTIIALIVIWWLASVLGWVSPLFLPGPGHLVSTFITLLKQGYMGVPLWQHVWTSLARVLTALGFAIITALPLGVLMGTRPLVRAALDPLIEFYRPIPPLAYLPLIVIWCGIGELSKVLLIYLALFAPLLISTVSGVLRVDPTRLQAARSLGASRWQTLIYIIIPSILPEVITGLRIALGVGWSTLVAAELIAADSGLGFMVQSAAQYLSTDVVMVGIIIIALIALVMEFGLRSLQKHVANW